MFKKFAAVFAMVAMVAMTGCDARNDLGECVGVTEDKDPNLVYDYDVGNIVVGILLVETLFVPAIVVLDQLQCPVARKNASK